MAGDLEGGKRHWKSVLLGIHLEKRNAIPEIRFNEGCLLRECEILTACDCRLDSVDRVYRMEFEGSELLNLLPF